MPTIQTKNIITTTYYQHAQRFVVEYTSKGAALWLPLVLSNKRRLRTAVRHGEPIVFCAKGAFPACRRQQIGDGIDNDRLLKELQSKCLTVNFLPLC